MPSTSACSDEESWMIFSKVLQRHYLKNVSIYNTNAVGI